MSNIPWIEKYRPNKLDDVIGQNNSIKVIKKCLENGNLPNMLFYGPPGTGKTSTILACARELYGNNSRSMILEMNASDERCIEPVRKKILKFVEHKGLQNKIKLVILDETDAMTDDAQSILRGIMERYSQNVRFCLICNYLNKINPALVSRTSIFYFFPLSVDVMTEKIKTILDNEDIKVSNDGIDTIIKRSKGDMRKILNTFESLSIIYKKITSEHINKYMTYPDEKSIEEIYNILNKDIKKSYEMLKNIISERGYSLNDIIESLTNYLIEKGEKNIENIIIRLAKIEINTSSNTNINLQILTLCGLLK